jgi:peptidoglycan/xylan/chitin deacetylase (PgdA/CDA1 family)
MVEPVRHRQTKGAATDMFEPKVTASHLDSTPEAVIRCLRLKNGTRAYRFTIKTGIGSKQPTARRFTLRTVSAVSLRSRNVRGRYPDFSGGRPPARADSLFGNDCLWEEGETAPRMLSIGLHLRMIGRPGRVGALRRILEHITSRDGVWITSRHSIAKHWLAAGDQGLG